MKLIFLFMITGQIFGQVSDDQLAGSWMGALEVGSSRLRLVFNISITDDASFIATLDSPDQGAKDIPLGDVIRSGDSLRIEAPLIAGYFVGKISSDTTMEGQWNQAGRSFDLNLKKHTGEFVLNRPQEPQPPFPYREEEVSFENSEQGFLLAGTLTLPEGRGPFPAVILVSGSGSQNRDEEIFGHKPFKLIADQLTRNGIAVLRYDDRGVGSSGGSIFGSTTADNALDALSAIKYLYSRDDINRAKTGIIGHSEGGMIAFMLASEHRDVAFIISLAGPGVDGKAILLDQSEYIGRLSGVEAYILKDNRVVMNKVYELMIDNPSYKVWKEKVLDFTGAYSRDEIKQGKNALLNSIPESSYAWMRYFVMFDPTHCFGSITCPVLALNGEKDCQVLAERNIPAILEGLNAAGNNKVTALVLPGLNHLFQKCETGLPAEYGVIEETFDPETLDIISDWILKLVKE